MSNIKEVQIEGRFPIDIAYGDDPDLNRWLAAFAGPSFGLKLIYADRNNPDMADDPVYLDNERGGETAYYRFRIEGQEALSWRCIIEGCRSMRKAGTFFIIALVRDVEENTLFSSILPDITEGDVI